MAYALTQLHAIVNKSFVTGRALPRGHAKTINYARETVGWVSEALPIVSRDSARAYRSKQVARVKPNARPKYKSLLFLFSKKKALPYDASLPQAARTSFFTLSGNGIYSSPRAVESPLSNAHPKNFITAARCPALPSRGSST